MPTKIRAILTDRNTQAVLAKGKEAVARLEKAAFPLAPTPANRGSLWVRAVLAYNRVPAAFWQNHYFKMYRERRLGRSAYRRVLGAAQPEAGRRAVTERPRAQTAWTEMFAPTQNWNPNPTRG